MKNGEILAIWLHDAAAKLFLGIQGERPVSRWVVVGTVMEPTPIGIWVNIDHIEERRPEFQGQEPRRVQWGVKPGQCVIRYDYMITAQRLKVAEVPDDPRPTPGFL
jgi:hypothetical protein